MGRYLYTMCRASARDSARVSDLDRPRRFRLYEQGSPGEHNKVIAVDRLRFVDALRLRS